MYCLYVFKASWCGHCKDFIINDLIPDRKAQNYKNGITKYIYDNNKYYKLVIIDADMNKDIVNKANIEGFPTIRLYKLQQSGGSKNQVNINNPDYEFTRRDKAFVKSVLETLKNKMAGGDKKETFTNVSIKSSQYTNVNNKINKRTDSINCTDGVCKRVSNIYKPNGSVETYKDVMPANLFTDSNYLYYDNLLDLKTTY